MLLTAYRAAGVRVNRLKDDMSTRICIPIYNRRPYRCSTSKFINRYCITRYLLRSSTLPLCTVNRSSICNYWRICTMIPTIYWTYYKPKMTRGPIWWGKPNILPTTPPRISWDTSTILRLSSCLHHMKYYFINRVNNPMELKKWRLWLEDSIWSIYNVKIAVISHNIWQKKMYTLPSWSSSETPLCTHTVWYRLFMFSYATPQHTAVHTIV
jgi:hypothetical protein